MAHDMFDVVATDSYVIEVSVRELREFPHSLAIAPPIGELLINCLERRDLGLLRSRDGLSMLRRNITPDGALW
jgi:hypothetical protein